jgi:hypothetical protein
MTEATTDNAPDNAFSLTLGEATRTDRDRWQAEADHWRVQAQRLLLPAPAPQRSWWPWRRSVAQVDPQRPASGDAPAATAQIELLEARLADLRAATDAQLADLRAMLAEVRADRDRWQTESDHWRTQTQRLLPAPATRRSWWLWRRAA